MYVRTVTIRRGRLGAGRLGADYAPGLLGARGKKIFSTQKNFFLSNDSLFSNKNFFEKKTFSNKKVLL